VQLECLIPTDEEAQRIHRTALTNAVPVLYLPDDDGDAANYKDESGKLKGVQIQLS
jgi:hypothetical protein